MKLTAKLTAGWGDKNPLGIAADELHTKAIHSSNYFQSLSSHLTHQKSQNIYQLEKLFRKNVKGFQSIKKFVVSLSTIPDDKTIVCYINVFAYSFLKGAKNFDLLLPLDKQQDQNFVHIYNKWLTQIYVLENFERSGKPIKPKLKEQYLGLRKIVSRPSVRDEIRSLATLLINGFSTLEELSEDMGLNYTLGHSTMNIFEKINVITREETQQNEQPKYVIVKQAVPVVVFCLRETLGLDLLSNLDI